MGFLFWRRNCEVRVPLDVHIKFVTMEERSTFD